MALTSEKIGYRQQVDPRASSGNCWGFPGASPAAKGLTVNSIAPHPYDGNQTR